ncbi:TadE/TadG family type IV pilus assembly protein [Erythrobacter litoralis]|uniref:TadE/TadG family type IV pilus assembly protein n=1 Tax=Erythrobacter litoralis TaxID=39960 RepID=UPI001F3628B3|nr:TadE family protein [Erythrobacter litoralis]
MALVEFAFISPIILLMGVVGIEMANQAVVNMRISQAAMHIADNASRIGDRDSLVAQKIYEGDINDLFIGVGIQAGNGIDLFENGRIVLSSLERNGDGGQTIKWQRCMGKKVVGSSYGGEGTGATGTGFPGMGESGKELQAGSGEAIMFVEIEYDYQPLVNNTLTSKFLPAAAIRSEAAFNVRNARDLSGIHQRSGSSSPVSACSKYESI